MKNNEELNIKLMKIEHKIDVLFDQLIDMKTNIKREQINERLEKVKNDSKKFEDEQHYLEYDLDNLWQNNSRIREEYRNGYYGDCEQVDLKG